MARSAKEIKDAIENLEAILDSGASTVAQDGQTTVFDLKQVRERLLELRQELATVEGKKPRRPLFNSVNMR